MKHSFRTMRSIINALINPRQAPRLCLLALAFLILGCAAERTVVTSSTVNYEGLAEVKRPKFDVAQVRPDTRFSAYDGIIVSAPELAFKTPDRSKKQFPLDEDQKRRFQEVLANAFSTEFTSLQNLELKEQPGPSVLELTVRVENITATVPSGRKAPIGFALTAIGEATLVLELRDSQSQQILARGADTSAIQGAALGQDGGIVTRWEDVEKLCSGWASMTRSRLDALIDQG